MKSILEKFSKLTVENRQDFLDLYLSRKDEALSSLPQKIKQKTDIVSSVVDYTPKSLITIWHALQGEFEKSEIHPQEDLKPLWYDNQFIHLKHYKVVSYVPETLVWIDLLAYYLGEVFIKNIGGAWEVLSSNNCTPEVNCPVFVATNAIPVNPLRLVIFGVNRVVEGGIDSADELYVMYKTNADMMLRIRKKKESGYVYKEETVDNKLDRLIESIKKQNNTDAKNNTYNYCMWVSEEAEIILGEKLYNNLVNIFEEIEGIEKVIQADREEFYIKSQSLSSRELKKVFKKVMRESYSCI